MEKEETFNEVMETFQQMHSERVYVEVEGNWLDIQFDRYHVSLNLWSGIVSVWDNEKSEEIYRVE